MGDHHKSDKTKRKSKYSQQYYRTERNKKKRIAKQASRKNFKVKAIAIMLLLITSSAVAECIISKEGDNIYINKGKTQEIATSLKTEAVKTCQDTTDQVNSAINQFKLANNQVSESNKERIQDSINHNMVNSARIEDVKDTIVPNLD